jgi:hypothetical protein
LYPPGLFIASAGNDNVATAAVVVIDSFMAVSENSAFVSESADATAAAAAAASASAELKATRITSPIIMKMKSGCVRVRRER